MLVAYSLYAYIVFCAAICFRQRVLTPVQPSATVEHAQSAFDHLTSGDHNASLVTTVIVGCALLAVNVLVLLCVCYHRKVQPIIYTIINTTTLSVSDGSGRGPSGRARGWRCTGWR